MAIYKCFKSDFDELTKRINRITKKLDKYGYKWHFEVIGESIEEVNVIDYTNYDNIPVWQFTPKNCGKIAVEVITYTFEMDNLKLGEYEVIAVLEHNAIEGSTENLIHVIKEGTTIPLQYRTVKSICEHCNSDRQRNKTVLLQDMSGNIKQVGTTCIHEYTGIDGLDIIAAYQDIHDIIIDNNSLYADYARIGNYPKYKNTLEYLSICIELINKEGYKKEDIGTNGLATKNAAWELILKDYKASEQSRQTALKVIDYFKNTTFDESQNFLNNIKLYVSQEYTKLSGFIAYAYIAYQKQLEYEAKKAAEKAGKQSEYVGKLGDKIAVELTLKKRITYETNYTYYGETQYIYIFEDAAGNEYKWNTSKCLMKQIGRFEEPIQAGEHITVKGTIKEHDEYNGTKQTVLTRCKIL